MGVIGGEAGKGHHFYQNCITRSHSIFPPIKEFLKAKSLWTYLLLHSKHPRTLWLKATISNKLFLVIILWIDRAQLDELFASHDTDWGHSCSASNEVFDWS